jgi:hypothetical protein
VHGSAAGEQACEAALLGSGHPILEVHQETLHWLLGGRQDTANRSTEILMASQYCFADPVLFESVSMVRCCGSHL